MEPTPPWAFTAGEQADDAELVARIVRFYRTHFRSEDYGGMWRDFFLERHQDTHRTFMEGEMEECAYLLRNPAESDMQYGFELTTRTHIAKMEADPRWPEAICKTYREWFVSLADAIGAVRMPPENQPHTERSNDEIADALEVRIGAYRFPNPFTRELGLRTSRGIASGRAIQGIYQAWRIASLTRAADRVVEIGAGLGRAAYYLQGLGARRYTIVDLPFSCLSSAYFLGITLGHQAISFPGEADASIRFQPPVRFLESADRYDLAVNIDSITELDWDAARQYAHAIATRARQFLSINHEANSFRASDLLGGARRYLYPIRHGYVEDHFEIRQPIYRRVLAALR